MIQMQQVQLQQLQRQQQQQSHPSTGVGDEPTASSDRSVSIPPLPPLPASISRSSTQRTSHLSNRRGSRSSSQATSPSLRPQLSLSSGTAADSTFDLSAGLGDVLPRRNSRDDTSFYQAEAAMLTCENQLLRQRIRELGGFCLVCRCRVHHSL